MGKTVAVDCLSQPSSYSMQHCKHMYVQIKYLCFICSIYRNQINCFLCSLVFACVRCVDLSTIIYEWRYYAFWKGVITPFKKALLRLSKMRYYAFPYGVITPFCA